MRKTIVLLTVLFQSVIIYAQTIVSLKSPSELLNAEINVKDKSVLIGLYEKENKVVDVKTLQLNLEENVLVGNWQVTDQIKKNSQSNLATSLW